MNNKTVALIVVILLVILGYVFFRGPAETVPEENQNDEEVLGEETNKIVANHYFSDGTHSVEGTLTLPTPCHTLTHEVMIAESFPEQVTINFQTHDFEGVCTQVIADKFFQVNFEASEDASVSATLDGEAIPLEFSETREGIIK